MVNPVGKRCSEAERAYLAGILDGDGAIMAIIEKHLEKRYRFRVRIIIKLSQNSLTAIRWALKTFNMGRIRQNRRAYDWQVKDQSDVRRLLSMIKPFIRVKRKQIDIATRILARPINNIEDLLATARLADALSKFNVRSKNRRLNSSAMIQEYFSRND